MTYLVKHGSRLVTTLKTEDYTTALKMFKMLKLDRYEWNGQLVKLTIEPNGKSAA
jgi:hypothetical protein